MEPEEGLGQVFGGHVAVRHPAPQHAHGRVFVQAPGDAHASAGREPLEARVLPRRGAAAGVEADEAPLRGGLDPGEEGLRARVEGVHEDHVTDAVAEAAAAEPGEGRLEAGAVGDEREREARGDRERGERLGGEALADVAPGAAVAGPPGELRQDEDGGDAGGLVGFDEAPAVSGRATGDAGDAAGEGEDARAAAPAVEEDDRADRRGVRASDDGVRRARGRARMGRALEAPLLDLPAERGAELGPLVASILPVVGPVAHFVVTGLAAPLVTGLAAAFAATHLAAAFAVVLGVAALGVAALGVAVLGVAALGVAALAAPARASGRFPGRLLGRRRALRLAVRGAAARAAPERDQRSEHPRAPRRADRTPPTRHPKTVPSPAMVADAPSTPPGATHPTVAALLAERPVADIMRLVAGAASLERVLAHPRIQKSGLVLVGHTRGIVPTRIQILGETEVSFLEGLDPATRRARCEGLFALGLSLVVITRGVEPLPELLEAARATDTPLAVAEPRSSQSIAVIHEVLDRLLAPSETRHGVLIDVHGIGTLLLGPSGIGKSECALFLVERGHRLVADDQVVLTRSPSGDVVGRPPPLLRHHLELRGIGIIHVRELFGATAVREEKVVQLVIELCPWERDREFDRLGLDDLSFDLLGVRLPMLKVPVQPGRNMAVILEVAARNHLLKVAGRDPAREFVRRLHGELGVPGED